MARKIFLKYPCGKLFEIKIPISVVDENGKQISVLPGAEDYFKYAQIKFQINNLKVIEQEVLETNSSQPVQFITLSKRIRCIE